MNFVSIHHIYNDLSRFRDGLQTLIKTPVDAIMIYQERNDELPDQLRLGFSMIKGTHTFRVTMPYQMNKHTNEAAIIIPLWTVTDKSETSETFDTLGQVADYIHKRLTAES